MDLFLVLLMFMNINSNNIIIAWLITIKSIKL
jgi:hypothetical protein